MVHDSRKLVVTHTYTYIHLEGSMQDFTVCGECGTVTMACPDDGSALIDPRLMECEWGHVTEPVEYNAEGIYTQVA